MKKSHQAFLRRIIGNAISMPDGHSLTEAIMGIKTPDSSVYRLMRDIVCDARFYSVIDNDSFWKTYGTHNIGRFIDSVAAKDWAADESLTMRKEDFLNEWMATHMLPLSDQRRKEIEAEIKLLSLSDDGAGMPDPDDHDGSSLGVIHLGNGIKDSTHQTGLPAEGLPSVIKDYMQDAPDGASSGLKNDSHNADANFLDCIDSSIVRLAAKIGRRGDNTRQIRGRFRPAQKSDISGVAVGNDLNSLLPLELALLASPDTERIFLDRYVKKKLQTFSSVSASKGTESTGGPIYICIDTSGSMTGEPEVLAKTLAMAISIIAQKEHRPVCIFNYSNSISFFVLRDLKTQRRNLMRFLSDSYGGGNDENKLFSFLFGRMPKLARYRGFANDLNGADLLVVSDFIWSRIDDEASALIDDARGKGMRIFTVGIKPGEGMSIYDSPYRTEDMSLRDSSGYRSGRQFFFKSDYRYVFDGKRIIEDFS